MRPPAVGVASVVAVAVDVAVPLGATADGVAASAAFGADDVAVPVVLQLRAVAFDVSDVQFHAHYVVLLLSLLLLLWISLRVNSFQVLLLLLLMLLLRKSALPQPLLPLLLQQNLSLSWAQPAQGYASQSCGYFQKGWLGKRRWW